MKINRDYFNNLEKPTFILRKASGDRINTIPVIEATYDEKYMDIDEANITVPLYIDNVLNPIYEQIEVMKYVEITNVGIFCIASVEVQSEGTDIERKNVNLKSLEWLLGQKYLEEFTINMGTVGSEDDIDLAQLMSKVLVEKFPDWGVDYIDPELASKQRSFDVSRQDIYSFLNEDIAQAFEATMSFNTFTKKVSVYKAEHFEEDTNIHISYNNLLKNTSLSSSTDEIKTALTVTGDDDLSLREINMGYDTIYNLDYFANEEYMSEELLAAYNTWQTLYHSEVDLSKFEFKDGVITRAELQGKTYEDAYNLVLLPKYQAYYDEIAKWTSGYVPLAPTTKTIGYGSFPDPNNPETVITIQRPTKYEVYYNARPTTGSEDTLYIDAHSLTAMYRWVAGRGWFDVNNWSSNKEGLAFCLNELNSQLASANNLHAVNLNNNTYSDAQKKNSTYLPTLYTLNAIDARIPDVKNPKYPEEEPDKPGILDVLEGNQAIIEKDMKVITDLLDMRNNLTSDQLKELSTFIREDELSAANYVVTDTMTTEEKFEMLQDMLQYGRDELAKVSVPQLTFSSELLNLYSMPEFDSYAEDFDIGKYLWVTLRDDFSVKAKLLTIHVNYFDPGDFSVTFGNVIRKGKNIFTDIQDAINAATSAATSVTFNASNWNEASKESNEIYTSMSQGLLSQSQYLGAPDKNKVLIDENGLWVTTSTGDHGKETTDAYDSIYLGGGRILLTSDGWKTVRMSMGRTNLNIHRFADTNKSRIEEVRNYSAFGTIADFVMAGTVEGSTIVGGDVVSTNYNKTSTPPKGTRLDLSNGAMYMYGSSGSMVFDGTNLNVKGTINATAGDFGADGTNKVKIGTTGQDSYIYSGSHSSYNNTSNGFYLGNGGLSIGSKFKAEYTGKLTASDADITGKITADTGKIGPWNIDSYGIYNYRMGTGQPSNSTGMGQGGGTGDDWAFYAGNGLFSVTQKGVLKASNAEITGTIHATRGEIGQCVINETSISGGSGESAWYINKDGFAKFSNVHISGVNADSSFGPLSLPSGLTPTLSGVNFDGLSYTFGKGITDGLNGIIKAYGVEAKWITADTIDATFLNTKIAQITTLTVNGISGAGNLVMQGGVTGASIYDTSTGTTRNLSTAISNKADKGWYNGTCNLTTGAVRIQIG